MYNTDIMNIENNRTSSLSVRVYTYKHEVKWSSKRQNNNKMLLDGCMCVCRHYQTGGTKAACIGQWWRGTRRGGQWHSSCAQKKTKWWGHLRNLSSWMAPDTSQTSLGPISFSSLSPFTELTTPLSPTSPNGCSPN